MIKYYAKDNGILVETHDFSQDCLITLIEPTVDEIEIIVGRFGLPEDFVYDSLDVEERARIDVEGDTKLIIMKCPFIDEEDTKIKYKTVSLGIILAQNFTMLISKFEIEFIDRMLKSNRLNPHKKSRMVFQILNRNALIFLAYLKEINKVTNRTEDKLEKSLKNKEVHTMLHLEKSLVYFTTSLRSNEILLEKLKRGTILELFEDDKELLEDTIVDNRQALEMSNIYGDILTGMMDAFASIISNNLNVVMKFLTIITILFQIPILITGYYGMNIDTPFHSHPQMWLFVILIAVVGTALTIFLLKKKKWI